MDVADFFVPPLVAGFDRGGAETLSSLWQDSHPQECVDEDAESPSLDFPRTLRVLTSQVQRTGSFLIPETMRCLKLARLPGKPLVPQFPIRRSTLTPHPSYMRIVLTFVPSIPHPSPNSASNSSNPHVTVQVSPVNSPTSPAKESSLSHESTLADIISTDKNPSDTTVGTETVDATTSNPIDDPVEGASEIDYKVMSSGSGDSDIRYP